MTDWLNSKIVKNQAGAKLPTALSGRNYWDGFKARNEALWDKVKNNTFVNMVFPVKEVSEGHTEAILPLVVPGGNATVQASNTIGKKAVEKAANKIKYPFGSPNSVRRTDAIDSYLTNKMNPEVRSRFEAAMQADLNLKSEVELQKDIANAFKAKGLREWMAQWDKEITNVSDNINPSLQKKHGGRLMRQGGKIIEVPFE